MILPRVASPFGKNPTDRHSLRFAAAISKPETIQEAKARRKAIQKAENRALRYQTDIQKYLILRRAAIDPVKKENLAIKIDACVDLYTAARAEADALLKPVDRNEKLVWKRV